MSANEPTHYVVLSGGISVSNGAKYQGEVVPRDVIPDDLFEKYNRKGSIRPANEAEIIAGKVTLAKVSNKNQSLESRLTEQERTIADLRAENRQQADRVNQLLAEIKSLKQDDLPVDYPGRKALIADKRFVTREAIDGASDEELLDVTGIGPALLKEIRDYRG